MKFGIFPRLTAGYMAVLLLLGASNVYAVWTLIRFDTFILTSHSQDVRLLDVQQKLVDALLSQQRYEQKYVITGDPALRRQFLAAKEDFARSLAELRLASASPAVKEAAGKIGRQHQRYQLVVQEEAKALQAQRSYDKNGYRIRKDRAADAILEELKGLDILFRQEFSRKARLAGEAEASTRRVAVAAFGVAVLLVILLSFFVTRSITQPLLKLVKKTRDIQSGRFECDLDVAAPPEVAELTEAFNRMCERLREVDQLKTDFFAMVSHALRTPLTTIQEGTSLLREGACGSTTEKQERMLSIIATESQRLTGLVNSILDLSKMEAGMMTYAFEEAGIAPLIDRALDEIAPYAQTKSMALDKRISPGLPLCRMDPERILDVLRNLIGNAVKFTPEGGRVTLTARPLNGSLEVSVADTGPGIPGDRLISIFEKYVSSDRKKGTGLGLALVRHIITAHGGKVWAESHPGQGSRFTFVLPC